MAPNKSTHIRSGYKDQGQCCSGGGSVRYHGDGPGYKRVLPDHREKWDEVRRPSGRGPHDGPNLDQFHYDHQRNHTGARRFSGRSSGVGLSFSRGWEMDSDDENDFYYTEEDDSSYYALETSTKSRQWRRELPEFWLDQFPPIAQGKVKQTYTPATGGKEVSSELAEIQNVAGELDLFAVKINERRRAIEDLLGSFMASKADQKQQPIEEVSFGLAEITREWDLLAVRINKMSRLCGRKLPEFSLDQSSSTVQGEQERQ